MQMQTDNDRSDFILLKAQKAIEDFTQESLYWQGIPVTVLHHEPTWLELRDAITSVLFDMDREQAEAEREAQRVVRDCV